MSFSIYEEITGYKRPNIDDITTEKTKVMVLLRTAGKEERGFIDIESLLYQVRCWLKEEGFSVEKKKILYEKCFNNDAFNHCKCFNCANVGKKTGHTCWRISW